MFINKSTDTANENVVPTELIIAKHRNGETAEIPLVWVGNLVHFFDGNPNNTYETESKKQDDISLEQKNPVEVGEELKKFVSEFDAISALQEEESNEEVPF